MALPSPIYWTGFSWEAFATLATGLTAVAAAWWVGQKQTAISRRQTEILARQVDLDNSRLRSELFDKRFEVYQDIEGVISEVARQGGPPDWEHQRRYLAAMHRSKFLFRAEVVDALGVIWKTCCAGFANYSEKTASYAQTGVYGQDHIEKDYQFKIWISEILGSLPEVFGDELKLGQKSE